LQVVRLSIGHATGTAVMVLTDRYWDYPTALAARVAVVRIGPAWTKVRDRSSLDDAARW